MEGSPRRLPSVEPPESFQGTRLPSRTASEEEMASTLARGLARRQRQPAGSGGQPSASGPGAGPPVHLVFHREVTLDVPASQASHAAMGGSEAAVAAAAEGRPPPSVGSLHCGSCAPFQLHLGTLSASVSHPDAAIASCRWKRPSTQSCTCSRCPPPHAQPLQPRPPTSRLPRRPALSGRW